VLLFHNIVQICDKLEDGRGGTIKFLWNHGCKPNEPFIGSYSHVRRHLYGPWPVTRSLGIKTCPNV
jgi:hypothetical protein